MQIGRVPGPPNGLCRVRKQSQAVQAYSATVGRKSVNRHLAGVVGSLGCKASRKYATEGT